MRLPSALGSRSVRVLRQEPPPTITAVSATLRTKRSRRSGRPTSRQAPGAPAVRPQTFGDGATREPGKLSKPANSERFELFVALPFERQQCQRQRREEAPDVFVAHDAAAFAGYRRAPEAYGDGSGG